jgi:hypothetical protein
MAGPKLCGLCRVPSWQLKAGTAGAHKRMSEQPESPSSTLAVSSAPAPGPPVEPVRVVPPQLLGQTQPRIPRWLERSELQLRVILRLYIGLAICFAPWSGQVADYVPRDLAPLFQGIWDQNPVFLRFTFLGGLAMSGAVRGIISGLGLLNLWVALQDIQGRREMRRGR